MTVHVPKAEIKKRKKAIVYFVFLAISAFFWLLIKLNEIYTLKIPLKLILTDPTTGIWIEDENFEHHLDVGLQSTGFVLLRAAILKKKEPNIHASLKALSPRKINQNEYYITAQSMRNIIAAHFDVNPEEIILAESELRIKVNPLTSKKIKVIPNLEISYENQYGPYGPLQVIPDSVIVFALKEVLDTLKHLPSKKASFKNIQRDLSDSVELMTSHPSMTISQKKVFFKQQVEKFTETAIDIEIEPTEGSSLKLFPNRVRVFVNVALKDYDKINSIDFTVVVDTSGLAARKQHLYLKLVKAPSNIQFVRLEPEKVEYLIASRR